MRIILPAFILLYLLGVISVQAGESTPGEKNYTTSNSNVGHVNQSFNIKVVIDHIFIKQENNSLKVSENVIFRNEGPEIYYSKDNHTFFAISTPPGLKDLQTQVMECCLVQEEGAVFMDPMQPIKPGENFEMQVSYTLLPQGMEYMFNKSAMYNTTSLLLFVDRKSGIVSEGQYKTVTLQGNEYNVIAFNDLEAGEMIGIPIKMTQEQGFLYAGIGLFLLFSTGLVYYYKVKIFRKTKEYTLDELEVEKKKIFHAIRSFEKHAGAEKSEEYGRLMEEYRQKAIQIFIKMDKIRNKI
ncbi:MAG: hypothetical protein FIB08_11650 [Candidatus Methanoperedens sp.]|nr:hypothetical protein [Candidatus Methanoperedens sp.]